MSKIKIDPSGMMNIILKNDINAILQDLDKMRLAIIQRAHQLKQTETAIKAPKGFLPHDDYHKLADKFKKINDKLRKSYRENIVGL